MPLSAAILDTFGLVQGSLHLAHIRCYEKNRVKPGGNVCLLLLLKSSQAQRMNVAEREKVEAGSRGKEQYM